MSDSNRSGYSGTPLPGKLGIKAGSRLGLIDAPTGFERLLEPLPTGVVILRQAMAPLDVIVFFTTEMDELARRFAELAAALDPAGGLWIAWPKKASRVPTDLTESVIREIGLGAGLVDNKVCAISEVWSGLRFVLRLANRRRA
jgi:hypothetical protein